MHPALEHLPGVLRTLEPVLSNHGYLAVGGLVLLEDFGVPVPGETVLVLAAVFAGAGRLSIVLVGVIAVLAAVIGDNIGFALGRHGGRRLIERYGRYVLLTPLRLEKATAVFERHGGKVVAVARFIDGLRQANGWIAGLSNMRWRSFLAFNALGGVLWVGTWTTVGYLSGSHINEIYSALVRYETYLAIAVAILLIAYIARRLYRRLRVHNPQQVDCERDEPPGRSDDGAIAGEVSGGR